VDSKRTGVVSIGFNYDPGNWFLMGEAGRMQARSFLGDKTASYLSVGYRVGDLTPYATFARVRADMPTTASGISLAGLAPPLAAAAAQLNGGLNGLLSNIARQRSAGAGLRWDFHANYSFKLQYDRVTPQSGSSGTLVNVQPGFRSGHAIGILSAAVDFVF
ncbi:MAG TPA: hypothetical protein VGP06_06420, partial [Janthinobacterium sp.]|nr:hypothetical protein [Janthinobacterium sp.]